MWDENYEYSAKNRLEEDYIRTRCNNSGLHIWRDMHYLFDIESLPILVEFHGRRNCFLSEDAIRNLIKFVVEAYEFKTTKVTGLSENSIKNHRRFFNSYLNFSNGAPFEESIDDSLHGIHHWQFADEHSPRTIRSFIDGCHYEKYGDV